MPFLSFLGPIVSTIGGVLQGLGGGGGNNHQQQQAPAPSVPPSETETFWKKYMGYIIGGGAFVLGLVIWLVSKPKKGW